MAQAVKVKVETKMRRTRAKLLDDADPLEVVVYVDFVPRGSGNRNLARRVAQAFRTDPLLKDHVIKATAGATRVTIRFRASLDAVRAVMDYQQRARELLDQEQLKLAF
jgi:hypothetical protein